MPLTFDQLREGMRVHCTINFERITNARVCLAGGERFYLCQNTFAGSSAPSRNEHTDRCHMVVDDYLKQLVRFRPMWTAHHKTHYPYSKTEERNWSGQLTTRDDVYECPHCLCQFFDWETVITETHIFCPDCGLKAALAF